MQRAMIAGGCWLAGAATGLTLLSGLLLAGHPAEAQNVSGNAKLNAAPPVTYDNKYEIYGGINFMNFQAGQQLPTRMNLGGTEILGTYWLTNHLGVGAEFRGEAGTTPVFPTIYPGRKLVYMTSALGGVQYRGPRNQRVAVNYHAYAGFAHGVFDTSTAGYPADYGLYPNSNSPLIALGGSLDINRSKNLAFRLSPDLMLEHFGTELREFVAVSGGVIYRFGSR